MKKELMIFNDNNVEIMIIDNEPMFELYSTGAALGYVTASKGKEYPHKTRINKTVKNVEISTVVHGAKQYLTEEQLYDFMLEARTDKCRAFRKWVTKEVLPAIRKQGAYITESATNEQIDAAAKFGPRRIKSTFLNCPIEKIDETFVELMEFNKNQSSNDKMKSYKAVRAAIEERNSKYAEQGNMGFAYVTKTFLYDTLRPIENMTRNRSNGALKANQTKKIRQLESHIEALTEYVNYIDPDSDDYDSICMHGFSVNAMYEPYISNGKPMQRKTSAYRRWLSSIKKEIREMGIRLIADTDYDIYLYFNHKEEYDCHNLHKSFFDALSSAFDIDDSRFHLMKCDTSEIVETYEDGVIYFCIRER